MYTACIIYGEFRMEIGLRNYVRTAIDSDGLAVPILKLQTLMH